MGIALTYHKGDYRWITGYGYETWSDRIWVFMTTGGVRQFGRLRRASPQVLEPGNVAASTVIERACLR